MALLQWDQLPHDNQPRAGWLCWRSECHVCVQPILVMRYGIDLGCDILRSKLYRRYREYQRVGGGLRTVAWMCFTVTPTSVQARLSTVATPCEDS